MLCPRFSRKGFLDFRTPPSLIFGEGGNDVQLVGGGLVPLLRADPPLGRDDVLGQQPFYSYQDRALAQSRALVEDASVPSLNTTTDLVERDVVAVLLKTERATNYVQEDLELRP